MKADVAVRLEDDDDVTSVTYERGEEYSSNEVMAAAFGG